jgi:two-component system response regulator HydG
MPPLRKRPEDIPQFIDHFLEVYRQRFNRPNLNLSTEARQGLQSYAWPGNVRELRNCLERAAAILAQRHDRGCLRFFSEAVRLAVQVRDTRGVRRRTAHRGADPEELEREYILRVLKKAMVIANAPPPSSASRHGRCIANFANTNHKTNSAGLATDG